MTPSSGAQDRERFADDHSTCAAIVEAELVDGGTVWVHEQGQAPLRARDYLHLYWMFLRFEDAG